MVHVVVERSRVKMLLSTLGSALFVVASLAIVAQGSAITLLVGAAGVITFTSFGLAWILLCLRAGQAWSWTTPASTIRVPPWPWAG